MGAAAAIPLVLGGLGLYEQSKSNSEAENQANSQLAEQQAMEQSIMAARQGYMDQVGGLQQQGAFNPAVRLQELSRQGQYDLTNVMNSEAGAARALGYRPGDSVPLEEMNQTRGNYELQQEQLANDVINQSNANYLAALQGAPSLNGLSPGLEAASENYRAMLGQQRGMGGMLASLGQYLSPVLNGAGSGLPVTSAYSGPPLPVGGGSYPGTEGIYGFGASGAPDGGLTIFPSAPSAPDAPSTMNSSQIQATATIPPPQNSAVPDSPYGPFSAAKPASRAAAPSDFGGAVSAPRYRAPNVWNL